MFFYVYRSFFYTASVGSTSLGGDCKSWGVFTRGQLTENTLTMKPTQVALMQMSNLNQTLLTVPLGKCTEPLLVSRLTGIIVNGSKPQQNTITISCEKVNWVIFPCANSSFGITVLDVSGLFELVSEFILNLHYVQYIAHKRVKVTFIPFYAVFIYFYTYSLCRTLLYFYSLAVYRVQLSSYYVVL